MKWVWASYFVKNDVKQYCLKRTDEALANFNFFQSCVVQHIHLDSKDEVGT